MLPWGPTAWLREISSVLCHDLEKWDGGGEAGVGCKREFQEGGDICIYIYIHIYIYD